MSEVTTFKKNKIDLSEYESSKDVRNRVLMSSFTPKDIEVLEEILYSSLRTPLSVLQENLGLEKPELLDILKKLEKTKLFSVANDSVLVNKEMRKYYEFQILKFEEEFAPNMEYLQALLKKVPIHVLPLWYSIPRSSNNIFESIVEKHLLTPQIYRRYLLDLNLTDLVQEGIMNELYQSPDYEVSASDLMKKFALSPEEFEEHMIFLEFNFVACVKFKRTKNRFEKVVVPFHEWHEYLMHARRTEPTPIIDEEKIVPDADSPFWFVNELVGLAKELTQGPIDLSEKVYPSRVVDRLIDLHLATKDKGTLYSQDEITYFLSIDQTEQALYVYRHPLSALKGEELNEELLHERVCHEAEKCLARAANLGWIDLDEFLSGIFIPIRESQKIELKKVGRTWKYQLPIYTEEEKAFFLAIIQTWLSEAAVTEKGVFNGSPVFRLSEFGQSLFAG